MNELYESIMNGLQEAVAFEKGKKEGTSVHKISINGFRLNPIFSELDITICDFQFSNSSSEI